VNGSSSDGCASGCSGCLLVIVAAALVAAGPPGWALGLGALVILVILGSQGNSRPRPLPNPRRRGAAMREAALLREARLEAVQQPPPQPVQPSHAVVSRDDPELDQLMEEARRALDDAL
jgi:hypothetical protein